MKPFYSVKGRYKDGRKKVMIVYNNKKKNFTLPKPEVLLETFKVIKNSTKLQKEQVKT